MVEGAEEHSNIATVYEKLSANEREPQETRSAFARRANLHRILARLPAPLPAKREKANSGEHAESEPRFSKAVSIIAFCGFGLLVAVTLSLWSHSAVTWLEPVRVWLLVMLERPVVSNRSGQPIPDVPIAAWSHAEVEAALKECVHSVAAVTADLVPIPAVREGECGTPAPVLLRSIGSKDKVTLDPPILINCPMVVALHRWFDEAVQPAAREALGSPVVKINGSSYACRTVYDLPNGNLSQHAFANALDLPAFILADGRKVDLIHGWGPTQRDLTTAAKNKQTAAATPQAGKQKTDPGNKVAVTEVVKVSASQTLDKVAREAQATPPDVDPAAAAKAKFLRLVQQKACGIFSTVLGPEANDVHRTHLHLDLQDRNSANVCK